MEESRRKGIGYLIFSIGLMGGLIGSLTYIYSINTGILIMLAIWLVGGSITKIILGDKKE